MVRQAHHEGSDLVAMPITNVAGCNALQPSTSLMVSLSNHAPWLCHPPIKQKSHQLIQHVPSALILLVSFPAGMLPETFESRERIGASASQGGKPVRPGRFGSMVAHWAKTLKNAGAGGPWIASIAYHIPQDPRSRDRPSFPPFNSQTRKRAWQPVSVAALASRKLRSLCLL